MAQTNPKTLLSITDNSNCFSEKLLEDATKNQNKGCNIRPKLHKNSSDVSFILWKPLSKLIGTSAEIVK